MGENFDAKVLQWKEEVEKALVHQCEVAARPIPCSSSSSSSISMQVEDTEQSVSFKHYR